MNAVIEDIETESREAETSAKRRQIMDGAREVFLSGGFDAASMNDIAKAAGVSKGTLYVYFESKEQLFEDLIREDRRQQAERMCGANDMVGEPREVLFRFGRRLVDHLVRPEHLGHVRAVMAVAGKFPRIGRAFYEAGPSFGAKTIARYLAGEAEKGSLEIADVEIAAWQFLELSHANILKKLLFSIPVDTSPEGLDRIVAAGVDTFMRAYGKRDRQG